MYDPGPHSPWGADSPICATSSKWEEVVDDLADPSAHESYYHALHNYCTTHAATRIEATTEAG